MNAEGMVRGVLHSSTDPFSFQGMLWIVWILVGIFLVWIDLKHKVRVGHLSIAALITVLSSFYVAVPSQVLVFCFLSSVSLVAGHARKEHLQKFRHYYVH
jgi:hypothetical protein